MSASVAAAAPPAATHVADMSFPYDDDTGATLAATLAFIDECDYSGDDDLTSHGDMSSSEVRSVDGDSDYGRSCADDEFSSSSSSRAKGSSSDSTASTSPTAKTATLDLFATCDAGSKKPSLRVVIRTAPNKRLTAATAGAPDSASSSAHGASSSSSSSSAASVSSSSSSMSSPSPSGSSNAPSQSSVRLNDKAAKRSSARAPTPMERPSYPNKNSVLRFRARKKAEAERLRREVVELEDELAALRRRGAGGDLSAEDAENAEGGDASTALASRTNAAVFWMDQAVRQARERHKSEALNKQLRDAVEKQKTMGGALQTLLLNMGDASTTTPALFGIDLLSEAQRESVYYDSFASVETRTMMGLEASALQMYNFSDAVFGPASVEATTQTVQVLPGHPETGPAPGVSYAEIRTSTPLGCTYTQASEMIWNLITTPPVKKERAYYVTKIERTDTRYQKNYTLFLEHAGATIELHGYSLLYRYIEPECVRFIWASSLTASSVDGPTVREKGWLTVSRSPVGRVYAPAALQVCHQIFSDDHARPTAASRFRFGSPSYLDRALAEDEIREFVLSYIVHRTRAQYQNVQSFLLSTMGKFITRAQIEAHVPQALKC